MKTHKLLPILLLLVSFSFYSQPQLKEKKEQIKALKVGFFTNELSLTADEAAKFWPVYNAFEDKQFSLRRNKINYFKDIENTNSLEKISDKEAQILLLQIQNDEDEMYSIRKKLISSLKGILSPIKIIKLKKAEENFNKKLLQQYRNTGSKKVK